MFQHDGTDPSQSDTRPRFSSLARCYNVVRELETRKLDGLDGQVIEEIAKIAKYSTTPSYLQNVFNQWRTWKQKALGCDDHLRHEFLLDRLSSLELEFRR